MKRLCDVQLTTSKRARRIVEEPIGQLMANPCCHLNCLFVHSAKSVSEIRSYYASLSEMARRQLLWTAAKYGKCMRSVSSVKQVSLAHVVLSHLRFDAFLCAKALQVVTGAGITRIREYLQLRTGAATDEDVLGILSRATSHPSLQREHLHTYIRQVVKDLSDNDPVDGSLHMPMGFSLQSLYRDYCKDPDTIEYLQIHSLGDPVSEATLHRLWNDNFSHVKVCIVCATYLISG